MRIRLNTSPLAITFLTLFAVGIATNLLIINYLVLLIVGAFYLPKTLSGLTRFVISFLTIFTLNILAILAINYLGKPFSTSGLLYVYSVFAALALAVRPPDFTKKLLFIKSDLLIAAIGIVFFLGIILPFRGSTAHQLTMLSRGEDNASHFALMYSIIKHHTLPFFESDEGSGVMITLKHYPSGLHANLALISELIPFKLNLSILIKSYAFQLAAYTSLLLIIVLLCMRKLALRFVNERTFMIVVASSSLALIAIGLGFMGLPIFNYGFHTQIVAYVLLLGAVLLLFDTRPTQPHLAISLLALLGVGISFVWFFLLPLYLGLCVSWLMLNRSFIRSMLTFWNAVIIVAASVLMIVPYLMEKYGAGGTTVNTPGGILPLDPLMLVLTLGIASLFILSIRKPFKKDDQPALILLAALFWSIAFSAAIALYQLKTIGGVSYYFYKSAYIIPIIASILASGFIWRVIVLIKKEKIYSRFAEVFCIAAVLCAGLYFSVAQYSSVANYGYVPSRTSIFDTLVVTPSTTNRGTDLRDTIFSSSCTPIQAYIIERWIAASMLADGNRDHDMLYRELIVNNSNPSTIERYSKSIGHLTVLFDPACPSSKGLPQESNRLTLIPYKLPL